jgi:predicted porin
MKKSLLAVAAIGAFASAAQAQSSVTVYGILDVGYIGGNTRIANNAAGSGAASTTTGVPAVVNTNGSGFGDSAQSTSRLGFKGSEDLGGGTSAFFTVEVALTPNAQQAISSSATSNRQTFAGLKKNGIGQFALGTQYTAIHDAVSATDAGQANNMMGDVIYDKASGPSMAPTQGTWAYSKNTANKYNIIPTVGTQQFSGMQNNTSYTVRSNNMLKASTDNFAGLQGNAFYVLNNADTAAGNAYVVNDSVTNVANSGLSGGKTNSTGWGLGANYTLQKLYVTANYQSFKTNSAYALRGTTELSGIQAQGGYGGTSAAGVNSIDNQQYYGATYDFGILKAYVQYVNRKTSDVNNSNNFVSRSAQQIGVRSFITPTIESWASTGNGRISFGNAIAGGNGDAGTNNAQSFGSNGYAASATLAAGTNSANFGGFQLGSNYYLSKRTNLYAIYGQQRTSNAVYTTTGATTAYNANNYAVGVRHTF